MDEVDYIDKDPNKELAETLNRKRLIERLKQGLTAKGAHKEHIASVQTWQVYWISHSLALLEQNRFLETQTDEVIKFIAECADEDGGYGGGPGQISHLATTFAAVNALITTDSIAALDSIDRVSLVRFLHKMKQPDGSFSMHEDGEIDSRATYCALAILKCLNIQDEILSKNVSDWILACQTYEGGFGSVPGSEAHGGYTFCCVASLCLLNQLHKADLSALLRWLTNKQMSDDGGFCGRSNKLVDSCYSYWQGAVFPLIYPMLQLEPSKIFNDTSTSENARTKTSRDSSLKCRRSSRRASRHEEKRSECKTDKDDISVSDLRNKWLFDCAALQDYVLNQCQSKQGLLRDKPRAAPDFYHTCYALSGLSISQHGPDGDLFDLGSVPSNELAPTHPLFNLSLSSLSQCFDYFRNKKIQTFEEEEGGGKGI